jgi:hypothetical protein
MVNILFEGNVGHWQGTPHMAAHTVSLKGLSHNLRWSKSGMLEQPWHKITAIFFISTNVLLAKLQKGSSFTYREMRQQ